MLVVFGLRGTVQLLGILTFVCGQCRNPAAQRVERLVRKFTLFFVPLFPVSSRTTVTCTYCGVTSQVAKEDLPRLEADLATARG